MLVRLPDRYPECTLTAELWWPGNDPLFGDIWNPGPGLMVTVKVGEREWIDPPGTGCELVEATAAERRELDEAGFKLADAPRENAEMHYDHGCELLAAGQPTDAVEAFTRAIQLNPMDAGALYNRGYAFAVLLRRASWQRIEAEDGTAHFAGDERAINAVKRAIADFTKAIELDPRKAAAFGMRAEMYWVTGQNDLAEADARAAAALGDRAAAESLRTRFGVK